MTVLNALAEHLEAHRPSAGGAKSRAHSGLGALFLLVLLSVAFVALGQGEGKPPTYGSLDTAAAHSGFTHTIGASAWDRMHVQPDGTLLRSLELKVSEFEENDEEGPSPAATGSALCVEWHAPFTTTDHRFRSGMDVLVARVNPDDALPRGPPVLC
jgi:hypothetical protein